MFAPKYVWITPSWYSRGWWKEDYGNSSCTPDIMRTMLNNSLAITPSGYFVLDDQSIATISGLVRQTQLLYCSISIFFCNRQHKSMRESMHEGFKWSITNHETFQTSYFLARHMMLCGQWHWDWTMPHRGSVAMTAVDVITFLENWFHWRSLITSMS